MLPSMPILFTRDSQDAFGNKIEPSTSFFSQSSFGKPPIKPEPPPPKPVQETPSSSTAKEGKGKAAAKKKDQGKDDPPKINYSTLESELVRSYFKKVQSRFNTHLNVPANKFVQFQNILKSFDPDKETPVQLYRKIEQLFGDEHKDIVEEFLLFLKPGQAAEVGRFMDHFVLVQMTDFIALLQTTLSRKPTVLRKVLRALTAGINSGRSEDMKTRVLPHFRSNPRLSQMFKALFPDERPNESSYEMGTEVLPENFLTEDKCYDTWELEDASDNARKLDNKQTLDTMYVHGRVFLQHGRMLRPARVTYPYSKEPYRVHARRLAPAHTRPSPQASDDERVSPKRQKTTPKIPPKRTKKPPKSPTKAIKDVNDNTNKECVVNSPKITKKQKKINKKDDKEKKKIDKSKKDDAKAKNKDVTFGTKEVMLGTKEVTLGTNELIISSQNVLAGKRVTFASNEMTKELTLLHKETTLGPKEVTLGTKEVTLRTKEVMLGTKEATMGTKQVALGTNEVNLDAKELMHRSKEVKTVPQEVTIETKEVILETREVRNADKNGSGSWTRDEDKTMLEVLKGEVASEEVFVKINDMLPHRSLTDIKERFCHVMNLLQQMSVGEVT